MNKSTLNVQSVAKRMQSNESGARPRTHMDLAAGGAYLDHDKWPGFQWSIQKRSSRGNSQKRLKFGKSQGQFGDSRAASNTNLQAARLADVFTTKDSRDQLIPYGGQE